MAGSEKREKPTLEESVVGFGGVEVSTNTVAAGEGCGGHVSAVKNVAFFNLGCVEEDGKADGIKDSNDSRVGGYERPGRHIGSEYGGFVFVDSGSEEGFEALVVEVV